MRVAIAVMFVFAAACFSPTRATNVPCSLEGNCPGDQKCDFGQSPPTCVDDLPDAGSMPDVATACIDNSGCTTPEAAICDSVGKFCRGCRADAECADGACSEFRGTCVAAANVLYVDPVVGVDAPGATCTQMMPCKTLSFAIAMVDATRSFVRMGKGAYVEQVKVQTTFAITISGEDDDPIGETLGSTQLGPIVQHDNGTLFLEGFTISGANADGIQSKSPLTVYRMTITKNGQQGIDHQANNQAALVVRASTITDNNNEGVIAQDGPSTITRSYIAENRGGGIRANRSALTLINTFVVQNGSPTNGNPGVRIQNVNNNPQRFELNTIAGNLASNLTAGVICEAPIVLKSSILANNNQLGQQMMGCTADHSLFSSGAPQGMGNRNGNPAFVDTSTGNFHILPTSDAVGRAAIAVDIGDDYDGDLRSGNALDCGADELP